MLRFLRLTAAVCGLLTSSQALAHFPANGHPTATVIVCAPNPVVVDTATTCTITVTDLPGGGADAVPSGTVNFGATGPGAPLVSSCTLAPAGGFSASCTIAYTPSAAGTQTLTATYPLTNTGAHRFGTSTGNTTLTVVLAPPTVSKAFSPAQQGINLPVTLTITLGNPNASISIVGVDFTDSYPGTVVNASSPGAATTCGGAVTAAAGGTSVQLSGGTIPAGGSCTVTVDVTSASAGSFTNDIPVGAVTSTNAGSNTVAASATVVFLLPLQVAKSFSPDSIVAGGASTLTITLTNMNAGLAVTGVAFTDTYPGGLVNAANAASPQCSGTVTGAAGSGSLNLTGGTVAAGSSCSISVSVTSSTAGTYNNTTGPVTSANAGTGTAAVATLTVGVAVGAFDAFDTSFGSWSAAVRIRTKVSGAAFSLKVVALDAARTAVQTSFSGTVTVELLGNTTLGVPLDAQLCPTSATTIADAGYPVSAALTSGEATVGFPAVSNAWRDVRVRVTYTSGGTTVTACSSDNFAIRPDLFDAVSASDLDWETAGGSRTLDNTGASGGAVHKAGRPFRLGATARNAVGGATTNYSGSPDAQVLSLVLPAACGGCSLGNLNEGTWSAAGGTITSDTASFDEVGTVSVRLVDSDFASVDSADGSTSAEREIVSAAFTVGRFVPDHFTVVAANTPEFLTFNKTDAQCATPPAGPTRSFTYIGQPFGYATAPSSTATARNFAGNVTVNYQGSLFKLTASDVSQAYSAVPLSPALDTSAIGSPSVTSNNNGTATIAPSATDSLSFTRDTTTPGTPFSAQISLQVSVADNSETAVSGNGTILSSTVATFDGGGGGIAFDSGNEFRYGRMRLQNAAGTSLLDLPLVLDTHYFNGVGFARNIADNCTAIPVDAIGMANFTGQLAACETALQPAAGNVSFTSGRSSGITLRRPGNGNEGSVGVNVNLGAAVSVASTCTSIGAVTAPTVPANLPFLRGDWGGGSYVEDPAARATFGIYRNADEFIYFRENF
jgi:MSHA biogenesis protein MshQ